MSERTLVLIKPDGVRRGLAGEVLARIERKGLRIVAMDLRTVGKDLAETHYAEHVAKPFYDRMISAGLVDTYPWLSSFNPADDFAIANIGQVKNVFSFEIPAANLLDDPLGNRLAAGQRAGTRQRAPRGRDHRGDRGPGLAAGEALALPQGARARLV